MAHLYQLDAAARAIVREIGNDAARFALSRMRERFCEARAQAEADRLADDYFDGAR